MDEPTHPEEQEPVPIPSLLHSAYLEGPFVECVVCGSDLSDPSLIYQIQKTWKTGEVVFELAVCARCAADSLREFSQESMERIRAFFAERYRPTDGLDRCHFCGRERDPGSEYAIAGECLGAHLLRPLTVICGGCTAASQESLSQKTRDAWKDFIDRNLPGVPLHLEPDSVPFAF